MIISLQEDSCFCITYCTKPPVQIFNRPCVAGAVLQTTLSLIEENTDTFKATGRVEIPKIKEVAKQKMANIYREKAEEDATRIPFQGVRVDSKCKVDNCRLPSNLEHMLNGCKKSLDRFKMRHDSVLAHLVDRIVACKPGTMEVCADLDGWRVNGGTVPSDLVATC